MQHFGKTFALFLLLAVLGCAASIGVASYRPIEKQWKNELAKNSVRLSSGLQMKYHNVGQENGKKLLLLHGLGDSSRSWYLTGEELLNQYHMYAPDFRGHGASSAPECCYTIKDYETDVITFMDEMKIDQIAIAGHSFGGLIAQRIAIDYPKRVTALILISSTDNPYENERLEWVWAHTQTSKGVNNEEFVNEWVSGNTVLPVPSAFLSKIKHEI